MDETTRRDRKGLPGNPPSASGRDRKRSETHLRSMQSLERLRDRVELAAREIKRLREENQALAARVRELEEHGATAIGSALSEMEDPEILKRKLDGFIEAVDRYIERENEQEAGKA